MYYYFRLQKRNITCGFFSTLIRGQVPAKKPSMNDIIPKIEKNPFAKSISPDKGINNANTDCKATIKPLPQTVKPAAQSLFSVEIREEVKIEEVDEELLEGPPNVPKEIVKTCLAQTDALIRRVMKCQNQDDPLIQDIIMDEEDFQLANFISKTLNSAISHFSRCQSKSNGQANGASSSVLQEEINGRMNASRSKQVFPIGPPRPLRQPSSALAASSSMTFASSSSTTDSSSVPPPVRHRASSIMNQINPRQDYRLFENSALQSTPTYFQDGLCGLKEPLLNYHEDQNRQRRRSGDIRERNDNPIPFKRKFLQNQDFHNW